MIRIAVAVAPVDALSSAFVVWRGIDSSMVKAAACGYDGIELALRSAGQIDRRAIGRLLRRQGLGCPAISTGQVSAGSNLYLTARDPSRRAEVIRVFRDLIDLAGEFGAMVNIGRARGFVEAGETLAETEARFTDAVRELATHAQTQGVTLVLEPVNRYEINFINSLEQGAELLRKVGAPNLALMPDLFHMNIEDRTLGGELERFAAHVAYVHFADSNRLAPGQGHTDFAAVFASLKRMRYDGWISVEILPLPDPDTAARQAIDYLRPFVEEYNRA